MVDAHDPHNSRLWPSPSTRLRPLSLSGSPPQAIKNLIKMRSVDLVQLSQPSEVKPIALAKKSSVKEPVKLIHDIGSLPRDISPKSYDEYKVVITYIDEANAPFQVFHHFKATVTLDEAPTKRSEALNPEDFNQRQSIGSRLASRPTTPLESEGMKRVNSVMSFKRFRRDPEFGNRLVGKQLPVLHNSFQGPVGQHRQRRSIVRRTGASSWTGIKSGSMKLK